MVTDSIRGAGFNTSYVKVNRDGEHYNLLADGSFNTSYVKVNQSRHYEGRE